METFSPRLISKKLISTCVYIGLAFFFFACADSSKPPEKDVVGKPEQLAERTRENLKKLLIFTSTNNRKMNDSVALHSFVLVNTVYQNNNYQTIWSQNITWNPIADSLYHVVQHAMEYGLFPADYNSRPLKAIWTKFQSDPVSRMDAALLARADVLFTEAYFTIARHLKMGRLQPDSLTFRRDSVYDDNYFLQYFNKAVSRNGIVQSFRDLEPRYTDYLKIRYGIKSFLDSARFVNYTYIQYPYKDSVIYIKTLLKRLTEENHIPKETQPGDSVVLAEGIKNYQLSRGLKPTGKLTESLVRRLNLTDWEKFKTIAVTLDRYKLLPDTLPETYALVNLPSYTLYVYDYDTLALRSKVIVGSPKTQTPVLNSKISNFITYPQWTVPYSIIFKEMLPKIQKNVDFLRRQNLMVVDGDDNVIDPETIDWSELDKNNFPYLIRQKEGDDNSLGVIKFNFPNKYSVYLHDTNARSFFRRSSRALSHGCVRVQEWEKLSHFLIRGDTIQYPPDTLKAWISRQEKHTITGFPKLPLFIRYFTVEGKNGKLTFYEDIYGDDRLLKEKYFSGKSIS
ncbi:MAG: L,D-transpeptidase family protein [Chitinophagaceae bacterium]